MRFISLIDNPFSRVKPTCPSVRIEIKLFPIVSDGVYWTTLKELCETKLVKIILGILYPYFASFQRKIS